jgi:isopentenyl diphosphate isomerase/L-lactate dehydrogenase-like FMN-dependent dehydrogenase
MWPDKSLSHRLLERAKAAGCEALIVSIDSPVSGSREYNMHNGFMVPFSLTRRNVTDVLLHPRWLAAVLARYVMTTGIPRYENYPNPEKKRITSLPMGRAMALNDTLNWDDLRELRRMWPRILMVKGLLHPQDAVFAADCGVDGVIVSNHGGRVVDGTPAPVEMVPQVVEAVGRRIPVLVDSGFRRGSDIVKALALGARAVLVGRATLYGTAVGGEPGALRALTLLREEIDRMLAFLGCCSIAELGPQHLVLPDGFGRCAHWQGGIARQSEKASSPRAPTSS